MSSKRTSSRDYKQAKVVERLYDATTHGILAQLDKMKRESDELYKKRKYHNLFGIIMHFIEDNFYDRETSIAKTEAILAKHKLEPYNPKIDYTKYDSQTFIDEFLESEKPKKDTKPRTAMSTTKEVKYPRTAMSTTKEVEYPRTAMSTTKVVKQTKQKKEPKRKSKSQEEEIDTVNAELDELIREYEEEAEAEKPKKKGRLSPDDIYAHYKKYGTIPITARGTPYRFNLEKYEAKLNKTPKQKSSTPKAPREKTGRLSPDDIYAYYKEHGTIPLTARGTPYKFNVETYESKLKKKQRQQSKGIYKRSKKEIAELQKKQEETSKSGKKIRDYNLNMTDVMDIPTIKKSIPKVKDSDFKGPEYDAYNKKMSALASSYMLNYYDLKNARDPDDKEFYSEMVKEKGEAIEKELKSKLATEKWIQEWINREGGDRLFEALKYYKKI